MWIMQGMYIGFYKGGFMELCSSEHEEICFEGRRCPICDKIKELNEEIETWKDQVLSLEEQVNELTKGE